MNKFKKIVAGVLALALFASVPMTAYGAATASTPAGKYGTLKGSLSGSKSQLTSITSITTNPDTAYLTVTLDAKNVLGNNVHSTGLRKSSRGITKYTFDWLNLNSTCTSVFGTQGVQGGSINPAAAVYTNTSL